MDNLNEILEQYEEKVKKVSVRFPERKGIAVKRLYTPKDVEGLDLCEPAGGSGKLSVYPGDTADHVQRTVLDDASVFRYGYL